MPPDLLAELAAEIDNVVAVKQANDDELGPIEGLDVLAGNDDVFLRTLESAAPAGSSSPRTWSAPRCARSTTPRRPATSTGRARSTRSSQPIYEALAVTTNPIPVKAALEMLGVARRGACGCRWSRPTRSERGDDPRGARAARACWSAGAAS